jgi:hypothetical protein
VNFEAGIRELEMFSEDRKAVMEVAREVGGGDWKPWASVRLWVLTMGAEPEGCFIVVL